MLDCTMQVDTPKQSVPPVKATHKIPASHPTIQNALFVFVKQILQIQAYMHNSIDTQMQFLIALLTGKLVMPWYDTMAPTTRSF